MSMSISALSPTTVKVPSFSRPTHQTQLRKPKATPFSSLTNRFQPSFNSTPALGRLGLDLSGNRKLGFFLTASSVEGENVKSSAKGDEDSREESACPDELRFQELPEPPVRWPWFVALGFLIYAWRAVLIELGSWKKGALAIAGFVGYILKILLALLFHFIGDPITSLIRCVYTAIYTIRAFYSGIVAYAPIPELTTIIMLASTVLAISEAAVPNSVSCQPYLLAASGLIGYAAVKNYIVESIFWTLLVGLYAFSRLVKKRDDVTSALPGAAILAAVGEPWVRVLVLVSYLALATVHHSKKPSGEKQEVVAAPIGSRLPVPLLCAAMAIGIRLAAKWAGHRHLTWMIV